MTDDLKKKTARRYTEAEKGEILLYVRKVNTEKGRGGVSAAVRHFGISPITVNSWLRSEKTSVISVPLPKSATTVEIYQRLADLHAYMESRKQEMDTMQKEYDELKKRVK